MKEKITETGPESRPAWESLEALARQGVRRLLQQLLEEEVEEVLGRRRYERRDGVDVPPGYRNGWGKPRRLSAMAGRISEGANLLYVARQLGHASVAITEKHYTRWIPQAVPAVHQLDDAAEATGSKTGSLVASSSANLA